jgi:hypothetical protein
VPHGVPHHYGIDPRPTHPPFQGVAEIVRAAQLHPDGFRCRVQIAATEVSGVDGGSLARLEHPALPSGGPNETDQIAMHDSNGMQVNSQIAQAGLQNGSGVICQACAGNETWASATDAPTGPGWGQPGAGDQDLIADGALVNSITDEIWVPGTGGFTLDPPGTIFTLETRGFPFKDQRIYPKKITDTVTSGDITLSTQEIYNLCVAATYLSMGGTVMALPGGAQDNTDQAPIMQNGNRGNGEVNSTGNGRGSGAGGAAAYIGAVANCFAGATAANH